MYRVQYTTHRYSTTHVARVSPGGGEVTCTQVYTNASSSSCTTQVVVVVPHAHSGFFKKNSLFYYWVQRLHTNWCTVHMYCMYKRVAQLPVRVPLLHSPFSTTLHIHVIGTRLTSFFLLPRSISSTFSGCRFSACTSASAQQFNGPCTTPTCSPLF